MSLLSLRSDILRVWYNPRRNELLRHGENRFVRVHEAEPAVLLRFRSTNSEYQSVAVHQRASSSATSREIGPIHSPQYGRVRPVQREIRPPKHGSDIRPIFIPQTMILDQLSPRTNNLGLLGPLHKAKRKLHHTSHTLPMWRRLSQHSLLPHRRLLSIHWTSPLHLKPLRQSRPHLPPSKCASIRRIERLIRGIRRENSPLIHITIQHSVRETLRSIPRRNITWILQRLAEVLLHAGVDEERVHERLCGVRGAADHEGGEGAVPADAVA